MGEEHNITPGGGASIGGDASAGRDLTGRDKYEIHAQNVWINAGGSNQGVTPAADESGPPVAGLDNNPFGYTGKLTDPAHYFVRQPLTREVFDELRKGVSLSIVGETQTGKSSLLWHIAHAGAAALGRDARDFAYIDLQLIRSEDDLFEELCERLGVPAARANKLARSLRGRKAVICLDECGEDDLAGVHC